MGHNLISVCHNCKTKVFHFRRQENVAILDFYKKHIDCAEKDVNNVQTVMDDTPYTRSFVHEYEEDELQPEQDHEPRTKTNHRPLR